jgi:ubiquinone biosynthesis protein UbiJ
VDPSLIAAATSACENMINQALRFDPATRSQLSRLEGMLAIQCTRPAFTVYCLGSDRGVELFSYYDGAVTTTLKGSTQALMGLLRQPATLANTGVELSGSTGLLQQWQKIFKQLDIDWEDAISLALGDIAGPIVANGLRKSMLWAKTQRENQQRLLKEYLTEELSLFPHRLEAQPLFDQIQEASLATDRLAAKVSFLRREFQPSAGNDGKTKS